MKQQKYIIHAASSTKKSYQISNDVRFRQGTSPHEEQKHRLGIPLNVQLQRYQVIPVVTGTMRVFCWTNATTVCWRRWFDNCSVLPVYRWEDVAWVLSTCRSTYFHRCVTGDSRWLVRGGNIYTFCKSALLLNWLPSIIAGWCLFTNCLLTVNLTDTDSVANCRRPSVALIIHNVRVTAAVQPWLSWVEPGVMPGEIFVFISSQEHRQQTYAFWQTFIYK